MCSGGGAVTLLTTYATMKLAIAPTVPNASGVMPKKPLVPPVSEACELINLIYAKYCHLLVGSLTMMGSGSSSAPVLSFFFFFGGT